MSKKKSHRQTLFYISCTTKQPSLISNSKFWRKVQYIQFKCGIEGCKTRKKLSFRVVVLLLIILSLWGKRKKRKSIGSVTKTIFYSTNNNLQVTLVAKGIRNLKPSVIFWKQETWRLRNPDGTEFRLYDFSRWRHLGKEKLEIILGVRRELITKSTEICYSGNGVKPRLPGC